MRHHQLSTYPLTVPGIVLGAVLGGLSATLMTPLSGLSLFVLCAIVGLTWRRGEAPILPFIVSYQWIAVTVAMFYERWVGQVPRTYQPGDLELTVRLSLIGLLVLAVGMRLGAGRAEGERLVPDQITDRGLTTLFWIVIGIYAIDYVFFLNPGSYQGAASLVEKGLLFRYALLMALWAAALTGPRVRVHYVLISFVWVLIPTLGRYYSEFKTPLFLLFLVMAAQWQPWDRAWWRRHVGRALALVPVAAAAVVLGVLWQGAIKEEARRAQDQGYVGTNPLERVEFFIETLQSNLPELLESSEAAVADLVGRLSYVTFFSRVLDHTPTLEPHAEGELLWLAVTNGTVPRFLFPDKPPLPSDSEYTRRFAGVRVPESADSRTSISVGYMAEFYADWGLAGMFLSVLGYGVWAGLLHRGMRAIVRLPILTDGAIVVVLMATLAFEHQFVRGFGSLNIGFAVTALLALVLTPTLRRILFSDPARAPIVLWSAASTATSESPGKQV
jgi:hypothetical protein